MPRGQPKKNTMQVTFRVNVNTIDKLKSINPTLCTYTTDGGIKFRHGALGRYLERLLLEDIAKREEKRDEIRNNITTEEDRVLAKFIDEAGTPDGERGDTP